MPRFEVNLQEIAAFHNAGNYLFRGFFEQDGVFDQLNIYCNSDKYRFKIPEEEISEVRQILDEYYYTSEVADSFEENCVVIDQDMDLTRILNNSVAQLKINDREVFLVKDELSVKQAAESGALPMAKSGDTIGEP